MRPSYGKPVATHNIAKLTFKTGEGLLVRCGILFPGKASITYSGTYEELKELIDRHKNAPVRWGLQRVLWISVGDKWMNRQIRTKNECVQWNVDEESVEMIHGSVRIFMARIDLYENFDKKTADTLAATAEERNTRMSWILYTRAADTAEVAENCPKIVVCPLCPRKEMEIMREFLMRMDLDMRIGWASKGCRHEIYCGEEIFVTIEPEDETLTHATLRWKFDD